MSHPFTALVGKPVKDVLGALAPEDGPNGPVTFFPVVSKGEGKDGAEKDVNIGLGFAGRNKAYSAQWPYTVLWAMSSTVTDADRLHFGKMALARAEDKEARALAAEQARAAKVAAAKERKARSLARLRKYAEG